MDPYTKESFRAIVDDICDLIADNLGKLILVMGLIILLGFLTPAQARCVANDKWSGNDKTLHFGGGAAISAFITAQTGDKWEGVKWATIAAGTKEVIDAAGAGTCSAQDFLATVAGGVLGAQVGGLMFDYSVRRKEVQVTYAIPLK